MTSKHTPGPWSVGVRNPYFEVWGPMRNGSSPILATMEHEPRDANVRLMAAAPELAQAAMDAWKALSWIIAYDSEDKVLAAARDKIEAAIEKAGVYDYKAMRARVAESATPT